MSECIWAHASPSFSYLDVSSKKAMWVSHNIKEYQSLKLELSRSSWATIIQASYKVLYKFSYYLGGKDSKRMAISQKSHVIIMFTVL